MQVNENKMQKAPRKVSAVPRSATTKAPTAIIPESPKDKLINSIRRKESGTGQWMPASKYLFASLLNEMGGTRKPNADDAYSLAINLFSQEKYLAAKSIVEKFEKVPRFVLMNVLCDVWIIFLIIVYSVD
jgi:hypothetical protein